MLKDGRIERLKLELERKDAEIQKLKNVITQWEVCKLVICTVSLFLIYNMFNV